MYVGMCFFNTSLLCVSLFMAMHSTLLTWIWRDFIVEHTDTRGPKAVLQFLRQWYTKHVSSTSVRNRLQTLDREKDSGRAESSIIREARILQPRELDLRPNPTQAASRNGQPARGSQADDGFNILHSNSSKPSDSHRKGLNRSTDS